MARPNQRVLREPNESFARWVVSLGLAAKITGGFSFGSNLIVTGRDQHSRQCEIAGTLATDDRLNDALPPQSRSILVSHALERLNECLKESV